MIRIAPEALRAVVAACEAAWPEEACGLLSGRAAEGRWRVRAAHASANLARDRRVAFEVDPAMRLRLHKALRGTGDDVVGVYHSHVNVPAQPSPRDLARAWEPGLVWLIVSVRDRRAAETAAHRLADGGGRFVQIPLVAGDRQSDPSCEAPPP